MPDKPIYNDGAMAPVRQAVEEALRELEALAAEWITRQRQRLVYQKDSMMSGETVSAVDADLARVSAAQAHLAAAQTSERPFGNMLTGIPVGVVL